MKTIQEINEIRNFLSQGELEEAVDAFVRFSQLHEHDNLSDYALLINSRFAKLRSEKIKGLISDEDYSVKYNRLTQAILEKLKDVEKEFTISRPYKEVKKGKIIHNIPGQMSKGVRYTCTIRLAPEDELLLRGFPLRAESKIEDIDELTEIMSVELLDESGGEMFEIRPVSKSSEQVIVDHSFTQWKFNVTALAEGRGCLILTVYAVYKVDGKNVQREIPYERVIDVESFSEDFLIENPVTYWEDTGMTMEELRARNKFSILAGLAALPTLAKVAVASSMAALLLVAGYLYLTPENIQPVLRLANNPGAIQAIRMNGEPVREWAFSEDSTLITLPAVNAAKLYEFEIEGLNGTCKVSTTAHLKKEAVITVPCQFIQNEQKSETQVEEVQPIDSQSQEPTPEPTPEVTPEVTPGVTPEVEVKPEPRAPTNRLVKVGIKTPFRNPLLYVDNAAQKPLGTSKLVNKSYVTEYEVSPGTYNLIVRPPEQGNDSQLRCNSFQRIAIQRDTELEFDCPVYHKLTIRTNAGNIQLALDGETISRSGKRERGSTSEHEYWVLGSSRAYTIRVSDLSDASLCKGERSVVMNQPQVLTYKCAEVIKSHTVKITASIPADYEKEAFRLLIAGKDNYKKEVSQSTLLNDNSLRTRSLVYEVTDLPAGTYNFRVEHRSNKKLFCTIENQQIISDTNLKCVLGVRID